MTEKAQRILLGRILAAHGIRGDVVIDSYTGNPEDIAAYGPLATEDGSRQFDISVVRATPKGVIARVAGVADRNGAEALKGTALYALRTQLPTTGEGEYYYADLVGLRAEDTNGERIGTVVAVQNYGAGDLLELRLEGQHTTELVPFIDAFVPIVDVAAGRVVVAMPVSAPEDEDDAS
ncbi:MAG: ribosome maturation factor RimM [Hyphomicrobium sp.]|nr:ribosome maturation factor RimM [Hyphomicrobium sp.]